MILYIADVPGTRDNRKIISDEKITQSIFINMAENEIKNARILLYHSLDNSNTDIA
jgi:hypothetical protein